MWDCIAGIAAMGGLGVTQPWPATAEVAFRRGAGSQLSDPCNKVTDVERIGRDLRAAEAPKQSMTQADRDSLTKPAKEGMDA
jgi:hypothetical protein